MTLNRKAGQRIKMPRWTVKIPRWKTLQVQEFHVEATYAGFLEGTTEGINQLFVSHVQRRVERIFFAYSDMLEAAANRRSKKSASEKTQTQRPIHFRQPTPSEMKRPLPSYLCMAAVTAAPVKGKDLGPDTIYSKVICCWLAAALSGNIESLIQKGIRPFDWDAIAENCEL